MSEFVQYLTKEELVFECRIRGWVPGSVDRVGEIREKLVFLLEKEEKGELEEVVYDFDEEEELLWCDTKASKLAVNVRALPGDTSSVPEKLSATMNHLSDRVTYHLDNVPKGENRDRFKRIAVTVLDLREQVSKKIAVAKDILKKIPTFSEIASSAGKSVSVVVDGRGGENAERRGTEGKEVYEIFETSGDEIRKLEKVKQIGK